VSLFSSYFDEQCPVLAPVRLKTSLALDRSGDESFHLVLDRDYDPAVCSASLLLEPTLNSCHTSLWIQQVFSALDETIRAEVMMYAEMMFINVLLAAHYHGPRVTLKYFVGLVLERSRLVFSSVALGNQVV
jgi:hypothetical protein